MNAALFEALFDELAERVAAKVSERLRAGSMPGAVAQAESPLGRRRHIAAVRRRVAAGQPGAAVVGRRHLLSTEALAEELSRSGRRPEASPSPASGSVRAELLNELRLVRGGGGR